MRKELPVPERPRLGGLQAGLIALAAMLPSRAAAAAWEDHDWALTGNAAALFGYDSNLFAVSDGPSDSFMTFTPSLTLARKDTLTGLGADAWASWTGFARETGSDSFDPGVRLWLAYPENTGAITTQQAEIHWERITDVNVDVGQRVSQNDALAKYQGDLFDAAKTDLSGRVSVEQDAFLGSEFTTITTGSAGATLSYSPDDLTRSGLGYDVTFGRSQPNSPGPSLDREEHAFTFQALGEFTPKLTGSLSVGGAYSSYSGAFSHSEWDAVANVDLTWEPWEKLYLDMKAVREPSFNADGNVDVNSRLELLVRQELTGGFAVHVDANVGHADHEVIVTYRSDDTEGGGAGLEYNLTGRLVVSANYEFTRQDSDVPLFTYTRHVATARLTLKF